MTINYRFIDGVLRFDDDSTDFTGVSVELWRWVSTKEIGQSPVERAQLLARAVVNQSGGFRLAVQESVADLSYMVRGRVGVQNRLRFRVHSGTHEFTTPFSAGNPGSGGVAGMWSTESEPFTVKVEVDKGTTPSTPAIVEGVVHDPAGFTLSGLNIGIRKYTLGSAVALTLNDVQDVNPTDGAGRFVVHHGLSTGEFDLAVEVEGGPSGTTLIAVSELLEDFGVYARVNVEVDWAAEGLVPVTEFSILHGALHAGLGGDPGSITGDTVVHAARWKGLDIEKVSRYAGALQLEEAVEDLNGGPVADLDLEVLYGLLAMGQPPSLQTLAVLTAAEVTELFELAVDRHIVRGELAGKGADIDAALDSLAEAELSAPTAVDATTGQTTSLQEILLAGASTDITATEAVKLVKLVRQEQGLTPDSNDIWAEWLLESGVTSTMVAEARLRAVLSKVFLQHLGVINTVVDRTSPSVDHPADLLKLSEADIQSDIESAITSGSTVFPKGIHGVDYSTRVASFVATARANIAERFPAAWFATQFHWDSATWTFAGKDWSSELAHAQQFFDPTTTPTNGNLPTDGNTSFFSIATTDVRDYFAGTADFSMFSPALTSTEEASLQAFLEAVQRLYRLCPGPDRYSQVKLLLEWGYTSAWSIQRKALRAFVRLHQAGLGGPAVARMIYTRAQAQVGCAMASFSALDTGMEGPPIATLPSIRKAVKAASVSGADVQDWPSWSQLFDGQNYCEPEFFESVLSPAAYLVDLLYFLKGIDQDGASPPESAFDALDGRRPDIKQVELSQPGTEVTLPIIDLVIELLEAEVEGIDAPTTTSGSSAERRAVPESRNGFDPSGAYVGKLDAAIYPFNLPYNRAWDEAGLFLEHLGLSLSELSFIYRGTVGVGLAERFTVDRSALALGISDALWEAVDDDGSSSVSGNKPEERWGVAEGTSNWEDAVKPADVFVRMAGIEASVLFDLAQTNFAGLDFDPVGCDLSNEDVTAPDLEDALTRAQSLLRLSRVLGWRVLDVDRVLTVLDATSSSLSGRFFSTGTSEDVRIGLAVLQELARRTGRSPVELAVFWGDIDTTNGRSDQLPADASQFRRRFLPPTLADDSAAAVELVTLEQGGSASTSFGDFGSPDSRAVNTAIAAALGLDQDDYLYLVAALNQTGQTITISSLSSLTRWTLLAEVAGLSVREVLPLTELVFDDIWAPEAKHRVVELLDHIERWGHSAPTSEEVLWLLLDPTDDDAPAAAERLGFTPDALEAELVELWNVLWAANHSETESESQRREVMVAHVATVIETDAETAALLLTAVSEDDHHLLAGFTSDAFLEADADAGIADDPSTLDLAEVDLFPEGTELKAGVAWTRLRKAAVLVRAWGLNSEDVDALSGTTALVWELVDLKELHGADAFDRFQNTQSVVDIRRRFVDPSSSLATILEASASVAFVTDCTAVLSTALGWDAELFAWLVSETTNTDWEAGSTAAAFWLWAFTAVDTARTLGLTPDQLGQWASSTIDLPAAVAIRDAARSRHTPEEWVNVVTPLQDELRVRQRDALLAYYIANDSSLESDADVHARLLIDPMVAPDQLTSRVKQALSSVQLFAHRVMLGLEGADLNEELEEQWLWMKNYRVWEAARKVFLWPENWIEPDLRTDQTELFDRFESSLEAIELTDDQIRDAYAGYLDGLVELGSLRVLAFVEEQSSDEDGDVDDVHVFARTRTSPPRYFWRTWTDRAAWTPWEELDLDIASDHLIPVVHDGRLLLIWPIWGQSAEEYEIETTTTHILPIPTPIPPPLEPIVYTETTVEKRQRTFPSVRFAVAEHRSTGWSAASVSTEPTPLRFFAPGYFTSPTGAGIENLSLDVAPSQVFFRAAPPTSESALDGQLMLSAWVLSEEGSNGTGSAIPDAILATTFVLEECSGVIVPVPPEAVWGEPGLNYNPLQAPLEMDLPMGIPGTAQVDHQVMVVGQTLSVPFTASTQPFGGVTLLDGSPRPLELVLPHTYWDFSAARSVFVVSDGRRTYFVHRPPAAAREDSTDAQVWPGAAFDTPPSSGSFDAPTKVPSVPHGLAGFRTINKTNPVATPLNPQRTGSPRLTRSGIGARVAGIANGAATGGAVTGAAVSARGPSAATTPAIGPTDLSHRAKAYLAVARNDSGAGVNAVTAGDHHGSVSRLRFEGLHHSHVCLMAAQVRRHGVMGLLMPDPNGANGLLRRQAYIELWAFRDDYKPGKLVESPYPAEDIKFDMGTPVGVYNWELFFHGPMTIADRMRRAQRFDLAIDWFHTVFDPTSIEGGAAPADVDEKAWGRAQSPWRTKPLYKAAGSLLQRIRKMVAATPDPADDEFARLSAQLRIWREHPFEPHKIAETRPLAYQKWVVTRYIETLIEWGDHLFRQDSIESLTEATQLYLIAQEVLGDRPVTVPAPPDIVDPSPGRTFEKLENGDWSPPSFDDYENMVGEDVSRNGTASPSRSLRGLESMVWFKVPPNPRLTRQWDLVEDRLFKVRNGYNIAGVKRALPLFQPPIDPAALVAAVASGASVRQAVSSATSTTSPPTHRYTYLAQKAQQLVGTAKSLGGALLQAMEKRDAEALASLRATHEQSILELTTASREGELAEAQLQVAALEKQLSLVDGRKAYYEGLLKDGALISKERKQLKKSRKAAKKLRKAAQKSRWVKWSGALSASAGFTGGKPTWSAGTSNAGVSALIQGLQTEALRNKASNLGSQASQLGIRAGHERRQADWEFQVANAERERAQVEDQLDAARQRLTNAETTLSTHGQQVANSQEVARYLSNKFTNERLYSWMVGQLASLYSQAYLLAFEMAKRAEASFQFETRTDDSFVRYGHWSGLRSGLLAGERLQRDLDQMDRTFLDEDVREYELTRHFSLSMVDPIALQSLRLNGECYFALSETLFDLDFPSHYLRRITSVSISIPAVTGKHSGVVGKLTLDSSGYRGAGDTEVTDPYTTDESIAFCIGDNDTGVFSVDRNAPKYIPFERRGAHSKWRLELTPPYKQFDWDSISDVVLTMQYTARDGAPERSIDLDELPYHADPAGGTGVGASGAVVGISLRQSFPDELYAFQSGAASVLSVPLSVEHLPSDFQGEPGSAGGGTPKVGAVAIVTPSGPSGGSGVSISLGGTSASSGAGAAWVPGLANTYEFGGSFSTAVDVGSMEFDPGTGPSGFDAVDDIVVLLLITLA